MGHITTTLAGYAAPKARRLAAADTTEELRAAVIENMADHDPDGTSRRAAATMDGDGIRSLALGQLQCYAGYLLTELDAR